MPAISNMLTQTIWQCASIFRDKHKSLVFGPTQKVPIWSSFGRNVWLTDAAHDDLQRTPLQLALNRWVYMLIE